mmetsp:Transcript_32357/g.57369  ORF Transcript_32357/g.57369 Transcript_32357/m.57369 type:complete len:240 (-) Transcript_32357:38-757(-)
MMEPTTEPAALRRSLSYGSSHKADVRTKEPRDRQGRAWRGQGRNCTACSRHECRRSCSVRGRRSVEQDVKARQRAESLARSLLCWRCADCPDGAQGFEDDPITIVRVGHDGSRPPKALETSLSRWLFRIMSEDQQRLEVDQRSRRRTRSQEAYERWLRGKDAEARRKADAKDKAAAAQEPRAGRHRPSQEACEQHYEAWCRRYDASRALRPASHEEPQEPERQPPHYVPVTFGPDSGEL